MHDVFALFVDLHCTVKYEGQSFVYPISCSVMLMQTASLFNANVVWGKKLFLEFMYGTPRVIH